MLRRTIAGIGALATAGALVSACGGGGAGEAGAAACSPDTTELRYGVHTEVRGFNVEVGGSVGAAGGLERAAVFDTLMEYDTKASKYVPRMAESFEPNDDATTWTLKLRDGIKFASGNPVTTEAVVFSVDRHRAKDTLSLYKPQLLMIESMDVVSPLEMVFHLKVPRGDFPAVFASAPGMLADPAVYKGADPEKFALDPGDSGAGPYKVESFTPGEEIVLKRRDDYWGKGEYCIGTIRLVFIQNEEARQDAFGNGELDMAFFQTTSIIGELRKGGHNEHMSYNWGDQSLFVNHGTGGADRPGSDLRVRKAIAYALDPKAIDQRASGGVGQPATTLVNEKSTLWSEMTGPPHDAEAAKKLLAEAKEDGYDGKLTLTCDNAPMKVEWAIAVKAMLDNVGFDVQLDNKKSLSELLTKNWETGDYDTMCFPVSMDEAQPWATFQISLAQAEPALSRVGYRSSRMGAAMDKLRAAQDLEEQRAAVREMQEVWNDEVPFAIVGHGQRGAFWSDNVRGVRFMNTAIPLFDDANVAR